MFSITCLQIKNNMESSLNFFNCLHNKRLKISAQIKYVLTSGLLYKRLILYIKARYKDRYAFCPLLGKYRLEIK